MKKLWFVLLVFGVLTGCSKDDSAENGGLPALPDPNDVCSAMDDINFMAYCYENFDVNRDGKVSILEAEAVRKMGYVSVTSLKGIERFPNLEELNVSFSSNSLSVIDLSIFQKLEDVCLYSGRLGTVLLPKQIRYVNLNYCQIEKLKCYAFTPPELFYIAKISTIYVPKERVAVYKATEPWKRFNIQPL